MTDRPEMAGGSADREAAPGMIASHIADLTYRGYDGPLHARTFRWRVVALSVVRSAVRKPAFWVLAGASAIPHLFVVFQVFLRSLMPAGAQHENPFFGTGVGSEYALYFHDAITSQSFFWLFVVALLVGAGSIAADNRANALLVYLSKPLTKSDYLIGKWVGLFATLSMVTLGPALLLYVYCLFTFHSEGFLREEPLLILRVIGAALVPPLVHSSLMLGFSAWSRSPAVAGACYAGAYFVSFAAAMTAWAVLHRGDLSQGVLVRHLSVSGSIDGIVQHILGIGILAVRWQRSQGPAWIELQPPSLSVVLPLAAGLVIAGIVAARVRIRAVEVVRG
ncbi:MAG TPA: ABC transporter permease subunit [Chthonomonadales bacterium]|nr:ABC transporter permease subunit [Chthonomonadales bacterium]